ncbi:MAG: phosphoribosylamine--glycine ligase, partial [Gemmatimonadetes bacterium]|nr:phosphoribosylamine--glycine ligase [Gemmatimonadota bacterium]
CEAVDIPPGDIVALAGWAAGRRVDLAVIGPEAPLASGLADRLTRSGVPAFGPTAQAARIEASKAFAKEVMADAGVPTAASNTFSDALETKAYIAQQGAPIVVKASGLAAGKGAIVCATVEEAYNAVDAMMGGDFGEAGRLVVVEEFMEGEELSVFYLTDGERFVPLLPSQDHKRIGQGDTGPNTGGMGAYAPVGFADQALLDEVGRTIVGPTLVRLAELESPFRGLLYAGLMITGDGPRVVEFNCRFGDPETQAVLPLMESSLLDPMMAIAEGAALPAQTPAFSPGAAVTTVVASEGYPGPYDKGHPIHIPDSLPSGITVFHAGTRAVDGGLVTSGGRVLAVTAVADSFDEARTSSRRGAEAIEFSGRQFREDIGWREAERLARP